MGKSIYLIAVIAILAIFLVVTFSMKSYEDQSFYSLNERVRQLQFESGFDSIYSTISKDSNQYCDILNLQMELITESISDLDYDLKQQKESFFSSQYVFVKKAFLMTNLDLYYKTRVAKQNCNLNIEPIVYFYDEGKGCEVECSVMENQLNQIANECSNVRVFAFPYNWGEFKFSSILQKELNVNKFGTIVIGNVLFDSVKDKAELMSEINCN
jgi:hypothetical protein